MIQRWLVPKIITSLKEFPIVQIVGARQTGKTTILMHLLPYDFQIYSLDDQTLLQAAALDPQDFVNRDERPMCIDEIQKLPALIPAMKLAVDRSSHKGLYLITSSANVFSLPTVQESLAGRIHSLRLRPITVAEQKGRTPVFLDYIFGDELRKDVPATSRDEVLSFAVNGGYPRVLDTSDNTFREDWFSSYISSILDHDIMELFKVQRLDKLERVLHSLAAWSSKIPVNRNIAEKLEVSPATFENYAAYLHKLFLVDYVPAFSCSDYKKATGKEKVFLADSGLMANLLQVEKNAVTLQPDTLGKLVETFAYTQLVAQCELAARCRLYHYRDRDDHEVDFIIELNNELVGLEIKASTSVGPEDFKHLKYFKNRSTQRHFRRGIVLYTGSQVLSYGDGMFAVPFSALWM